MIAVEYLKTRGQHSMDMHLIGPGWCSVLVRLTLTRKCGINYRQMQREYDIRINTPWISQSVKESSCQKLVHKLNIAYRERERERKRLMKEN